MRNKEEMFEASIDRIAVFQVRFSILVNIQISA